MIIETQLINEENPAAEADWQASLREMIRSPEALLQALDLPPTLLGELVPGHQAFPIRVTRSFLRRMRRGDPHDPLLLQVLPQLRETVAQPGYTTDPLAERDAAVRPGLLHKYDSRVLLISTSACAIHCRYCFRRHFPYTEQRQTRESLQASVDYIQANPEVREVIFSGGDPLMLNDRTLAQQIDTFARLPQIRSLRFHSRLPIVLPERITEDLLKVLANAGKPLVMVVHANHPQEIDDEVSRALQRLREVATVLNQTVLLRDINDAVDTLATLSDRLFAAGTLPYYLHQLDPVTGVGHFEVSDDAARDLHSGLLAQLPGYLVPRLVREIAGESSKTPLV